MTAGGRYARQTALPQIGEEGQRRLSGSRVAVFGLGALGSVSAPLLARAGVGFLRLIDRDYVSLNNLQRSGLFTEGDAEDSLPKAVAAARHLALANSGCELDVRVANVDGGNIEGLLEGIDVAVDGSDNFELRYLLCEASDKLGIPWVYGAAVGTTGAVMPVVPGITPCLSCLAPDAPPPGSYQTCATAGILGTATGLVAVLQATEALKLLLGPVGDAEGGGGAGGGGGAWGARGGGGGGAEGARGARSDGDDATGLLQVDPWYGEFEHIHLARDPECPTCALHRYTRLGARPGLAAAALCGRDEYQVIPAGQQQLDLPALAQRLRGQGEVRVNPYTLSFDDGSLRFRLFADGRMMLKGAKDEAAALQTYSEYLGT
jgi:adenylyltransferase/sulfurtransferase